jgi:ubiquinone/menaquinone biosynthesis C-methylase UbiE
MKRNKLLLSKLGDLGRSDLIYGRHLIKSFLYKSVPYESVLDLGAGKGDDLLIAKEYAPDGGGAKCYALESYKSYVKILKSKGIEVFNFDLEKERFPFNDESIDIIMINQVMEHVKEVFWILHEVTRVLKKDGHFIVGVPNLVTLKK